MSFVFTTCWPHTTSVPAAVCSPWAVPLVCARDVCSSNTASAAVTYMLHVRYVSMFACAFTPLQQRHGSRFLMLAFMAYI